MYLRELRTIMLEKLLADFLHGVDIYLKHFREQSDNAVKFVSIILILILENAFKSVRSNTLLVCLIETFDKYSRCLMELNFVVCVKILIFFICDFYSFNQLV